LLFFILFCPSTDEDEIDAELSKREALFVNRSAEVAEAMLCNVRTDRRARSHVVDNRRYSMVAFCQHWGAGKTTVTRFYGDVLSGSVPSTPELLKALRAADITDDDLAAVCGMKRIAMDCVPGGHEKNLLVMADKIKTQCIVHVTETVITAQEYFSAVLGAARRLHPLQLVWDELSELDEEDDVELFMHEYRALRAGVIGAIRATTPKGASPLDVKPVHVFVAGKLSLPCSLALLQSPSLKSNHVTKRVYLQALLPEHVEQLARNYMPACDDATLKIAAQELCRLTVGVPRAIHHALASMTVLGTLAGSQTPDAVKTAVGNVVRAVSEVSFFDNNRLTLSTPEEKRLYTALAACDLLDIPLIEPEKRTGLTTEQKQVLKLLDATQFLPVMFEPAPDGRVGQIPRVSAFHVDNLPEAFDAASALTFALPHLAAEREVDIVRAIQVGFVPHFMVAKLHCNHLVPLTDLVPFLPTELHGIHLRADNVDVRLLKHEKNDITNESLFTPNEVLISGGKAVGKEEERRRQKKGGSRGKEIETREKVCGVRNHFSSSLSPHSTFPISP
jgi:hypothetical protein